MNKRFYFFSLFCLLIVSSFIVSAQVNKSNLTEGLRGIKNQIVSEPVFFPYYLAIPFAIIFGVEQGSPLNLVVIQFGVWLLAFIFIFNMAAFVPHFKKSLVRLIVTIIVTILMSISGGFDLIVDLLMSLNDLILKITGIESYTIGFIIVFVLVVAFLYIILHLSNKYFVQSKLEKDEDQAALAGLKISALSRIFRSDDNKKI